MGKEKRRSASPRRRKRNGRIGSKRSFPKCSIRKIIFPAGPATITIVTKKILILRNHWVSTLFGFLIEWSRIEPEEGKFDEQEIEHYRKVLYAIRARGHGAVCDIVAFHESFMA